MPSDAWLRELGLLSDDTSSPHGKQSDAPNDDDLARAEWGLLHQRLLHPDRGYDAWLRVGAALKPLGEHGLRLWIESSRPSKDFDEAEIRRKWPGITGSSIASLFGMFDDADPDWRHRCADATQPKPRAELPTGDALGTSRQTVTADRAPWPEPMPDAAFRGLGGDFIRLVEAETEADRHALLIQFLVFFGNCIGRSPYLMVGATRHGTNLFTVICGASSRGRKGTSEAECRRMMRLVDEAWTTGNICSGLSSGEGLIDAVRDPRDGPPDKKGKPTVIPGVTDKRCMISEGEFARVLAQVAREGNVLSSILRQAWDGDSLRTMVRGNPARATDPHVSLVAHVTQFELLARMSETDLFNGLGNRFLWCCSRRTKKLPFGGNVNHAGIEHLASQLKGAMSAARRTSRLGFTAAGTDYWAEAYIAISVDRPGMWGAMTARAEAQVLRLGMLYALLDSQSIIDASHLESARAVWDYCDASVAYLFGNKLGNVVADKLYGAIKASGTEGISRTKLSAALGRNTAAAA
ncbi:MAG: PriCT-2 domain-containing protein, partial [Planctomycetota bacterium]